MRSIFPKKSVLVLMVFVLFPAESDGAKSAKRIADAERRVRENKSLLESLPRRYKVARKRWVALPSGSASTQVPTVSQLRFALADATSQPYGLRLSAVKSRTVTVISGGAKIKSHLIKLRLTGGYKSALELVGEIAKHASLTLFSANLNEGIDGGQVRLDLEVSLLSRPGPLVVPPVPPPPGRLVYPTGWKRLDPATKVAWLEKEVHQRRRAIKWVQLVEQLLAFRDARDLHRALGKTSIDLLTKAYEHGLRPAYLRAKAIGPPSGKSKTLKIALHVVGERTVTASYGKKARRLCGSKTIYPWIYPCHLLLKRLKTSLAIQKRPKRIEDVSDRLAPSANAYRSAFSRAAPLDLVYLAHMVGRRNFVAVGPSTADTVSGRLSARGLDTYVARVAREARLDQVKHRRLVLIGPHLRGVARGNLPKGRGRRVDLDFRRASVRNILRLLAEVLNINLCVHSSVEARSWITVRNMPADQVLEMVVRSAGLHVTGRGSTRFISRGKLPLLDRKAKAGPRGIELRPGRPPKIVAARRRVDLFSETAPVNELLALLLDKGETLPTLCFDKPRPVNLVLRNVRRAKAYEMILRMADLARLQRKKRVFLLPQRDLANPTRLRACLARPQPNRTPPATTQVVAPLGTLRVAATVQTRKDRRALIVTGGSTPIYRSMYRGARLVVRTDSESREKVELEVRRVLRDRVVLRSARPGSDREWLVSKDRPPSPSPDPVPQFQLQTRKPWSPFSPSCPLAQLTLVASVTSGKRAAALLHCWGHGLIPVTPGRRLSGHEVERIDPAAVVLLSSAGKRVRLTLTMKHAPKP